MTEAACSASFSAGSSRSIRAASTACTESGTSKSPGSCWIVHAPLSRRRRPRSISVESSSSTKNGLPSARATTTLTQVLGKLAGHELVEQPHRVLRGERLELDQLGRPA